MSNPKKPMATPARERAATPEAPISLGLEDVKALIELVARESIHAFDFEGGGLRFRIRKDAPPAPVAAHVPMPQGQLAPQAPPMALPAAIPAAPTVVAGADSETGVHYITSPIVGSFYRSPSPASASFVQVGDVVRPGQTLCIIEAMKLMNEIECDVAGEVVKVLVENGQPVEYGERLFAIRIG